ncbi:MAG: hypothetical protein F6K56_06955, partial [Moorea sp. SIO3G5]|nr:hypothetical protein [Moorena sp. SIO3G5]
WHLASVSKGGTGIWPVVLKVELASGQWFYKWNWHLASGSTSGTGIKPVILQLEMASSQ